MDNAIPQPAKFLTLDQALQQAIDHHQAGRLQDAERLYRAILKTQPNHPDANHNLGVIAVQVKQPAAGLPHLKVALEVNPNQGQYWLSYIDALIQTGQTDAARQVLAQGRQRGLQGEMVDVLSVHLKDSAWAPQQSAALHKVRNPSHQERKTLVATFAEGRYSEAATLAQVLTVRFPLHGFGWKALGAVFQQMGRSADALAPMQKAAALLPGDAEAHGNLGNTLKDLGRLDEAEVSYRLALEINPDFAEAHNNLGATLRELGRLDEAEVSYRRALEIKPDYAEANSNLGVALQDLGRLDEAEASCRRALKIKPDFADAHYNLGNTLQVLSRLGEAEASYRRALEIKPDFAEVHNNLGVIHQSLGRLDEAEVSCRRALEIVPDYVEAHNNLGNTLQKLGRLHEAEVSLRRALEIKPDLAEAHNNLGSTIKDTGRLDEAEASYRRALQIKPDYAEAHNNLGSTVRDMGRLDEAEANYRRALEIKPDFTEAYNNLLFTYNLLVKQSPEVMLVEARRFGELVAQKSPFHHPLHNVPNPIRCLRIGFVSGDLRDHPVGYFLDGVLAELVCIASGRLEFYAYPCSSRSDALTERINACCKGWYSAVGQSDEILARQIHEDGIDILIDLSGHTAFNRLPVFAWKPAPVQVTWLGYFATTGVAAIDYLIADPWVLPESDEIHFTEKIWRLPETRLCFTPPNVEIDVSPLPALTNGCITFGCFNNLTKINDAVVALWARVLESVPGSCLFLKAKQFKEASVRQSILERFAVRGIGAERLILEEPESRAKYLSAYHRVDIALDPFPFPGGTTSVEGLWMGVPVLTLAGERFLSRQGVGILQNAGLPEWIASDADDYLARAVSHAGDLQRLAALRNGLRQRVLASPLFDSPRFARHFEAALRGMWMQWCNQQQGQTS